jgi:hypothetical protein
MGKAVGNYENSNSGHKTLELNIENKAISSSEFVW